MSVVGIDQSLTGTGIAEIDNDGNLVRHELIKVGELMGVERLSFICEKTLSFCRDVKDRFIVAREGYSFASRGRATFSLGELGGCIDLTLFRCPPRKIVSYYSIPPTVVKKFCLGSGNVKKDSGYLLKVFNKFRIEFPDDNQADAFMIAKTLLAFFRAGKFEDEFEKMTLIQKEAVLSSMIASKNSTVTKAVVKKMEKTEFAVCASEAADSYLVFTKEKDKDAKQG